MISSWSHAIVRCGSIFFEIFPYFSMDFDGFWCSGISEICLNKYKFLDSSVAVVFNGFYMIWQALDS